MHTHMDMHMDMDMDMDMCMHMSMYMCMCPALHDLGVRDLQSVPSPLVTTRHRRAARVGALRLRLRLREGLGSRGRQPRRAALTRAHRSCFARHLRQSSKVIATSSSGIV